MKDVTLNKNRENTVKKKQQHSKNNNDNDKSTSYSFNFKGRIFSAFYISVCIHPSVIILIKEIIFIYRSGRNLILNCCAYIIYLKPVRQPLML